MLDRKQRVVAVLGDWPAEFRQQPEDLLGKTLSDAFGALPAVMFSPGDVEIVAGAAGVRRRFVDIMLALSSRGYLHAPGVTAARFVPDPWSRERGARRYR